MWVLVCSPPRNHLDTCSYYSSHRHTKKCKKQSRALFPRHPSIPISESRVCRTFHGPRKRPFDRCRGIS
uniref:Uncharacterized protein n=1 Tax=Anguilla anguilla TaxID=7936 RepID=A0A0E9TSV5_ANGAN